MSGVRKENRTVKSASEVKQTKQKKTKQKKTKQTSTFHKIVALSDPLFGLGLGHKTLVRFQNKENKIVETFFHTYNNKDNCC